MNSNTVPSFWEAYRALNEPIRRAAQKAYRLWAANRRESLSSVVALQMRHEEESVWSVRVTLGYRALGVLDGATVTWFWIGSHDEYGRFIG